MPAPPAPRPLLDRAASRAAVALLLFGALAVRVEASSSDVPQAPRPTNAVEDLVERWTPVSRHWRMPDGSIRATVAGAPFQYRDRVTGSWEPIVETIEPEAGGAAARRRAHPVEFPAFAGGPILLSDPRGNTVAWSSERFELRDDRGRRLDANPVAAVPLRLEDPRSVSFAGAFGPGARERWTLVPGGIEGALRLEAPPFAGTTPGDDEEVAWSGRLLLPVGWTLREATAPVDELPTPTGAVELVDDGGRVAWTIPLPLAWEESAVAGLDGSRAGQVVGRTETERLSDREWRVTALFPRAWFRDPARSYPVVLDPTFAPSGGWGGWLHGGGSLLQSNPSSTVFTANSYSTNTYHGFIQWDVSSIPGGSVVDALSVSLYLNLAAGSTSNTVYLNAVRGSAPWGAWNSTDYNDLGVGSYRTASIATTPLNSLFGPFTFSSTAMRDLENRLSVGTFLLGLEYPFAGAEEFRRFSSGSSTLDVTYRPGPPFGVVINEVSVGTTDWVELYNYGGDVDLTGWVVRFHDPSLKTWTIPAFTLGRHQFVRILEGTGTNTTTVLYSGLTLGWATGTEGQAGLTDASGNGIDYLNWNSPAVPGPPSGVGFSGTITSSSAYFSRARDIDHDLSSDWTFGAAGTPGALGALQVGTRPRSSIRINEVDLASTSRFELINYGVTRDLSGWELWFYTSAAGSASIYTIPAGRTLWSGSVVRLHEGTGADTASDWFTGLSLGFAAGGTGEISLRDPYGRAHDYVGWGEVDYHRCGLGTTWAGDFSPGSSPFLARRGDIDVDAADEWAGAATGGFGSKNAGQIGTSAVYDELGSGVTWTSVGSSTGRGNVFDVTDPRTLTGFSVLRGLDELQDLSFVVLEQVTPGAGAWNVIFQRTRTGLGPSTGWFGSGPMNVALESGRRYALMVHHSTTVADYGYDGAAELLSFGTFVGRAACAGAVSCTSPATSASNAYAMAISTSTNLYPDPVEVVTGSLPHALVGQPYAQSMEARGGAGGYAWSIVSGSLPSGITLSSSGALLGNPAAGTAGSYTITFRATDTLGSWDDRTILLEVLSTSPVTILTDALPPAVRGVAWPEVYLQAVGGASPYTWAVISGALPSGIALTPSTGRLAGTPTVSGSFTFTVRATPATGSAGTKVLTLLVSEPPEVGRWVRKGFSPSDFSVLGLSSESPTPTIFVGGESATVFKSTDLGVSWTAHRPAASVTLEPVTRFVDLAVSPGYEEGGLAEDANSVFALVETAEGPRLLRTRNGGTTWQGFTPPSANGPFTGIRLAPSFALDGNMVVFGPSEAWVSQNAGGSWTDLLAGLHLPSNISDLTDVEWGPDGSIFIVAADKSQLYRTRDLGADWTLMATNAFDGELAISPHFDTDGTMIAVWSATLGLAISRDGGFGWNMLGISPPGGATIRNVRFAPQYDGNVPSSRTAYWMIETESQAGEVTGQLWRTVNGFRTVERVDSLPPRPWDGAAGAPTLEPPVEIDAGFASNKRMFHAGDGFWTSVDGGASWRRQAEGLGGVVANDVTIGGSALFVATASGGLFKTTGGGAFARSAPTNPNGTGSPEPNLFAIRPSPTYSENAPDGTAAKTVFAAGSNGLYRSSNGGRTWSNVVLPWNTTTWPVTLFELAPSWANGTGIAGMMVAGYRNGSATTIYRSTNSGTTWSLLNLPTSPVGGAQYALHDAKFSPSFATDQCFLVSYLDRASRSPDQGWTFKSSNFGASAPSWSSVLGGAGGLMAGRIAFSPQYDDDGSPTDPLGRRTFWLGFHMTTNRGSGWLKNQLEPLCVDPDFPATSVVLGNRWHNDVIYDGFWVSTNGGSTANAVAAGEPVAGLPITGCAMLTGFGAGGFEGFASAAGGGLFASKDIGSSWTAVPVNGSLPDNVNGSSAHPTDPNLLMVATTSGLYKSDDRAESFRRVVQGFPTSSPIDNFQSVMHVPVSPNVVLAGTAIRGVWRSTDGGESWSQVPSIPNMGLWVDLDWDDCTGTITVANSIGQSYESGDLGASFVTTGGSSDFVDFSSAACSPLAAGAAGEARRPVDPWVVKSGIWGMSGASGAQVKDAAAIAGRGVEPQGTWIAANGTGDYAFPFGSCTGQAILARTSLDLAVASCFGGGKSNIYWSTDAGSVGGSNWRPVDLADPTNADLAASSLDVETFTESPNGDLLAGVRGTTNGGAFLSANGGAHWMEFNDGFDPDELRLQDLITQTAGGETVYYAGKPTDGFWANKYVPAAPPTVSALTSTSGPSSGGGSLTITGSGFQAGAVAEFDGVPCVTTSWISASQLGCVGIPPHLPATVAVRVRNPDTRTGTKSDAYTYTAAAPEVVLTSVTRSGNNLVLAWTDQSRPGNLYRVYRSRNVDFSGIVEVYPRVGETISCAAGSCTLTDTRNLPGSNATTAYYYRVE